MNKDNNKLNMFPNSIFRVELYNSDGEDSDVVELNYLEFINYIHSLDKDLSTVSKIHIYPNGDDIMKILCGVAPMWKEHESKEFFENYYTISEMMRTLYMNERDEYGVLVPIYTEINGKRMVVTWEATQKENVENVEFLRDMYNDTFHYRDVTYEECGILNILKDIFPVNNIWGDSYRLIRYPNFIMVYDEDITLKKTKEIFQKMLHHGFAQANVRFNVDV